MKTTNNSAGCGKCTPMPLFLLCTILTVLLGCTRVQSARTSLVLRSAAVRRGVPGRFQPCSVPDLNNGRVTIRSRGRVASFRCGRRFQMVGQKFSTCIRGHWTSPPPLCVRPGCERVLSISNGVVSPEYNNSLLNFHCNPGYSLSGSPAVFCNGRTWNSSEPVCEGHYASSQTRCDFEHEDLCGWTPEKAASSTNGVQWLRSSRKAFASRLVIGPTYDHTHGDAGNYMYVSSNVPSGANRIARIFSPAFSAGLSQDACFSFWYFLHGQGAGSINVYVKPEGVKIENVKPILQKNGREGNDWLEGFFNINKLEVPFQIVIEGVRRGSYSGDIAFDDVRLDSGSTCERPSSPTTSEPSTHLPNVDSSDSVQNPQSCSGRCGESLHYTRSTTASMLQTSKVPELIMCDCHVSCVDNNACCSDFHTYCIRELDYSIPPEPITTKSFHYNTTDKIETSVAMAMNSGHPLSSMATPASFTPTTITSFALTPFTTTLTKVSPVFLPSLNLTNMAESTEVLTTPLVTTDIREPPRGSRTQEPTYLPTSKRRPPVVIDSSPKPFETHVPSPTVVGTKLPHPASRMPERTTPTTDKYLRTTILLNTRTTTRATTRLTKHTTIRTPLVRLTTPTKPRRLPPAPTHPTTTTTRQIIKLSTRTTKMTTTPTRKKETAAWMTEGPTEMTGWLEPRVSATRRTDKSTLPLAVGGTVVALLAGICTIVLVFVVMRRRRRRRHRNHLSEDSDVRFLTADEILDFTLATPKEYHDDV